MNVLVGVITYRRPEGLAALLEALRAQEASVVVIDNDPAGSARAVCNGDVRYVHEPRRGLSFARNRALDAARQEGVDYLAFIDDDEVPQADWLERLLHAAREYRAEVVAGRVERRFERDPPAWVRRGNFFVDPRLPTGAPVRFAATSNVLISSRLFELRFDARFALTGGEDTHFFLRAGNGGHRLVWADDAVVVETVPVARARLGWILRRAYRLANTWSLCERDLDGSPRVLALRAAKAFGRLGAGAALLVGGVLGRRRYVAARGLWHLAFGAGNLTGLLGVRFAEYHSPTENSASRS